MELLNICGGLIILKKNNKMNKINTNITFSNDEKEIISIIKNVVSKYSPSTQVYIVGGFVRDKLMGIEKPNDLDIMVYPIDAESFAKLITKHLQIKDPHVIKANPEKSKNISTCKVYLTLSSGKIEEVDIAQARKDVYTSTSRNPEVQVATPQEDSFRRDLTINSIFYDIINEKIIDFTGLGIKDLITNTIRTPLNPLQTFKDDPLRIFRTIRFSAKYNGTIDKETLAAMNNPELKMEIRQKISKERIGIEIKKMLQNPNPLKAIQLLKETGLFSDIIDEALKGTKYEGKMSSLDMNQDNPNHKLSLWEHTFQVLINTLEKYKDVDDEKRIVMILAALSHDLGKLFKDIQTKRDGTDKHPGHENGFTSYVGHEEESSEIIQHILKFLKLDSYIQQVGGLTKSHMQPHSLSRDNSGEKALRKFIRRCGEMSLNWLDVFNLAIADAYSKDKTIDPKTVQEYQDLEKRLQAALVSLNMEESQTKVEPIINGNEIMQALNIKPGIHMKDITEFVKDLKDENPNITKNEAILKLQDWWKTRQNPEIDKIASKLKQASVCPKHLFKNKFEKVNELMDLDRDYEALAILNQLRKQYEEDESISRLAAISVFKAITKDPKLRDNDLIQFIFNRAENNFFDPILGSYTTGILMMIKSGTPPEVISELSNRMSKLSPGTLRSVLDSIPKNRIVDSKAFENIQELLKKS